MNNGRRSARAGHRPWLRLAYRWAAQVVDPVRLARAPSGFGNYFRDWWSYRRMEGAEALPFVESHPQIHDRTLTTSVDHHYFYANTWAMQRVVARRSPIHVDVGSHHMFVALLASIIPVVFVDFRPLRASVPSLHRVAADALNLPFAARTVPSISCLHAAEHIGLGRYGDQLDPGGTRKACKELARVLAPGGQLLLAVPVGRPRTCFNAHRVHDARVVVDYFPRLDLLDFALVDDTGTMLKGVPLEASVATEYGCGLFRFRRS